ncbi:ribonuclease H-like domain-containing protein [Mycena vulgaris]|nr:ribonuclease H-like domain-containing protein [Mycena vulgaris]
MSKSKTVGRASRLIGSTFSAIKTRFRSHPVTATGDSRALTAEHTTTVIGTKDPAIKLATTAGEGTDTDTPTLLAVQTKTTETEGIQGPSSVTKVGKKKDGVKENASQGGSGAEITKDTDEKTLTALLPFPRKYVLVKVESEAHANAVLRDVVGGKVGFDTEFTERTPTREEKMIDQRLPKASALRKAAVLGWQIVELDSNDVFPVAWSNIGLRLIQIARDDTVWVLDMWKIRAVPVELVRILTAIDIQKTGAGLTKDIMVIWDDVRVEMKNLVDVGMMAKLLLSEKYPKMAYGNLALKTCVEDILGFELSKELTTSDWKAKELTDAQIEYAGLDAIACIRLYEVLIDALDRKGVEIGQDIPAAWYTFNSKSGEPTRTKLGWDGFEVTWRTSDCTWYGQGKFIGYP